MKTKRATKFVRIVARRSYIRLGVGSVENVAKVDVANRGVILLYIYLLHLYVWGYGLLATGGAPSGVPPFLFLTKEGL